MLILFNQFGLTIFPMDLQSSSPYHRFNLIFSFIWKKRTYVYNHSLFATYRSALF